MQVLLLIACSTPSPPESKKLDTAMDVAVPRPEPSYGAAEVQGLLDQLLSEGIPEPFTVRDTFLSLLRGADQSCPEGNGAGSTTSYSGCTSTLGWTYTGSSAYAVEASGDFVLASDIYVSDPQGNLFEGGGQVAVKSGEQGAHLAMDGTWGYSAATGWFAKNPSFNFETFFYAEQKRLVVSGGLSMEGQAVTFEELELHPGCDELFGGMTMRDPNGWWYALDLRDDCSGCGTLRWAEEELGEVCVPAASMQTLAQRFQR